MKIGMPGRGFLVPRWIRKILLNMLISELLKNGSLTKKEYKILQEQSLYLNKK